jgi:hypothetical protein
MSDIILFDRRWTHNVYQTSFEAHWKCILSGHKVYFDSYIMLSCSEYSSTSFNVFWEFEKDRLIKALGEMSATRIAAVSFLSHVCAASARQGNLSRGSCQEEGHLLIKDKHLYLQAVFHKYPDDSVEPGMLELPPSLKESLEEATAIVDNDWLSRCPRG